MKTRVFSFRSSITLFFLLVNHHFNLRKSRTMNTKNRREEEEEEEEEEEKFLYMLDQIHHIQLMKTKYL